MTTSHITGISSQSAGRGSPRPQHTTMTTPRAAPVLERQGYVSAVLIRVNAAQTAVRLNLPLSPAGADGLFDPNDGVKLQYAGYNHVENIFSQLKSRGCLPKTFNTSAVDSTATTCSEEFRYGLSSLYHCNYEKLSVSCKGVPRLTLFYYCFALR